MGEPDRGAIARVRCALAGGHWANLEDMAALQGFEERRPDVARLVRAARRLHAEAARHAVSGGLGVLVASAGYPADPEPYGDPVRGVPLGGRFVLADADPAAAEVSRALRACWPGVAAVHADAARPHDVLDVPEVRELAEAGPLQLQAELLLHWLPAAECAAMLAGWAAGLPSGSEVVLTMALPDGTDWTRGEAARLRDHLGAEPYEHSAEDLRGWLAGAGLARIAVSDVTGATGLRVAGGLAPGRRAPQARAVFAVAQVR